MDSESVRNMQSDLAVTNKQYCQSCILLVLYIIQTNDARKLKHKVQSDLAVTNKQYCQSCILLVLYIIQTYDARKLKHKMQSDLAVTNKQYCQSCILLFLYIIQTYDARKLRHKILQEPSPSSFLPLPQFLSACLCQSNSENFVFFVCRILGVWISSEIIRCLGTRRE